MGIITSMLIDYEDAVYQYTPQRYSVDVNVDEPYVQILTEED